MPGRARLVWVVTLLLGLAICGTSVLSFLASRDALQHSIVDQELPLTADNIYSEIERDLLVPLQESSMMASDTFLRDWALDGERDSGAITKYLATARARTHAFTSYFVSERTGAYYTAEGLFKHVSATDPHDRWFFSIRNAPEEIRIDVDTDQAHGNALTIFINARVFDYDKRFIGVTGVGLTVHAVDDLLKRYQARFGRTVYFVDQGRHIVVSNSPRRVRGALITDPGVLALLARGGGVTRYRQGGHDFDLNVRYIPELHWYVFVESDRDRAMAGIRRALYSNLAVAAAVTAVVAILLLSLFRRDRDRLASLAMHDPLTGLGNRQALRLLAGQLIGEASRDRFALSAIIIDADHFKDVNDRHGHIVGDGVLRELANAIRDGLRDSDLLCRWGGEEFVALVRGCDAAHAGELADKLRARIGAAPLPLPAQQGSIPLTVSAGVAQWQPGETLEALLARADAALYQAKRGGRDRVQVWREDA